MTDRAAAFAGRIQAICPGLVIHSAVYNDMGSINDVVIVNEALVFRFVRPDTDDYGLLSLADELRWLLQLYGGVLVRRLWRVYPEARALLPRARFYTQALELEWAMRGLAGEGKRNFWFNWRNFFVTSATYRLSGAVVQFARVGFRYGNFNPA